MNLQIDLFSNSKLTGNIDKVISPLYKSKFELQDSTVLAPYVDFMPEDIFTMSHINNVLIKSRQERDYTGLFGIKSDSHIELEKAGLSVDTREHPYRIIISLADSLDLLLSNLANCPWEGIADKIDNYLAVSRGILTLDFNLLGDMSLDILFGICPEIDRYLAHRDSTPEETVLSIYESLLRGAQRIVSYIALEIKQAFSTGKNSLVFKSRSYSEVVLSCRFPINEEIILSNGYKLKTKCVLAHKYLEHVQETFRG